MWSHNELLQFTNWRQKFTNFSKHEWWRITNIWSNNHWPGKESKHKIYDKKNVILTKEWAKGIAFLALAFVGKITMALDNVFIPCVLMSYIRCVQCYKTVHLVCSVYHTVLHTLSSDRWVVVLPCNIINWQSANFPGPTIWSEVLSPDLRSLTFSRSPQGYPLEGRSKTKH